MKNLLLVLGIYMFVLGFVLIFTIHRDIGSPIMISGAIFLTGYVICQQIKDK